MPELGEVEYYRRRWDAGLGGKILKVEAHPKARPLKGVDVPALTRALEGARLASSSRHGKQLFFYFQPRAVLGLHMGMTGHLSVREPGYEAKRHDHLVLRQKERTLVFEDFRMFGRVRFSQGKEKAAWEKDLPPEILDPAFTLPYLAAALKGRRGPLKALLLDQAIFPGIGNWMADEVLWLARIAPRQAAGSLPPQAVRALHDALRKVCRVSLRDIPKGHGNGEDWGELPQGWLFAVRWKKGGDCPRCGKPLKHAAIGGRTACWCPHCQLAK
ncbi:MAG: hypothetical protein PW734_12090 [Verrucomicrobium sp.]|nr:hypothetical protein [Verrucomicrobium sp.]